MNQVIVPPITPTSSGLDLSATSMMGMVRYAGVLDIAFQPIVDNHQQGQVIAQRLAGQLDRAGDTFQTQIGAFLGVIADQCPGAVDTQHAAAEGRGFPRSPAGVLAGTGDEVESVDACALGMG